LVILESHIARIIMPDSAPDAGDYIQVTRQGDLAVIRPSAGVENLTEGALEEAAQMVLRPLRERPPGGIIVDLTGVQFVGSVFLSFLLRCHKIVRLQGSEMVLAGVTPKVRELLRLTALDTIWALYDTEAEAREALGTD
jgi:anti-anti-sigma factor